MPGIKNVNPSTVPLIVMLMVDMRMTVGATLWFERRLHLGHLSAQPNDHCTKHMVGQQPQARLTNLQRNMSITDVISNPGQLLCISSTHFKKCFELGLHRDDPTVVEL